MVQDVPIYSSPEPPDTGAYGAPRNAVTPVNDDSVVIFIYLIVPGSGARKRRTLV